MTLKTKEKRAVRVEFCLDERKLKQELVYVKPSADYKDFGKLIGSSFIDVVEFNEEIDIVVDDEGLLVSDNPVLGIDTPYGEVQLAGSLLFVKKVHSIEGIELVGLDAGELFNLLTQLEGKIKVLGVLG